MPQADYGAMMRWPAVACLMTLLAAGCGSDGGDAGDSSAPESPAASPSSADEKPVTGTLPAGLGGVTWRLVSIRDDEPVPASAAATIVFEGDSFSGQAPCNRYFGSLNTDPGTPVLFGPVGATRMMCPDAQMQYEDMFLAALGFTRNIHIDGDRLILEWMSIDGGEWGDMVFRVDTQPDGQE